MMGPTLLISQVLLYFPGTFLCYPWKPLVNWAVGDSFAVGYAHFRRDHATPLNLALHFVCLVGQLVANFGVVGVLDAVVADPLLGTSGARVISTATAIAWVATLLLCPVPIVVRLLSAAAVAGAYVKAPDIAVSRSTEVCSSVLLLPHLMLG